MVCVYKFSAGNSRATADQNTEELVLSAKLQSVLLFVHVYMGLVKVRYAVALQQ